MAYIPVERCEKMADMASKVKIGRNIKLERMCQSPLVGKRIYFCIYVLVYMLAFHN